MENTVDIKDIKHLLGGLEKYGLDEDTLQNAFHDTVKRIEKREPLKEEKTVAMVEEDFLLLKSVVCPVCDYAFSTMVVKSGKARRMQPDFDLRPRYECIDVNKYDVTSCRKCGYTALNKDFSHLTAGQMQLINEGVKKNYKIVDEGISDFAMSYDTAIERYKLALYNSIVKRAHVSEKAYVCLKISWLYRGKIEMLIRQDDKKSIEELAKEIEVCKQEETKFYVRAYEGMIEARAQESFPICGMDVHTFELMLSAIAYNLDRYEEAARLVSGLLVSRTVNIAVKNRAVDLKEMILERIKENSKNERH